MNHAARVLLSPFAWGLALRAGLAVIVLAAALTLSLVAPRPAPVQAATFIVTPEVPVAGDHLRFQVDSAGTFGDGFVEGAELPTAIRINVDRTSATPGTCVARRLFGFGIQSYGIDLDITGPGPGWDIFGGCNANGSLRAGDYIVSLDYRRAIEGGLTSSHTIDVPIHVIGDRDGDGVLDNRDNCPDTPNPTQTDTDGNGKGDACDIDPNDRDSDGIRNEADNCPDHFNPSQVNSDADTLGDACDPFPFDRDNDGIQDASDNCPTVFNPSQDDDDGNGVGNACETDLDGDGVPNTSDNCPLIANPDQVDSDAFPDGHGDACDPPDSDGDGVADETPDNCSGVPNPEQTDTNGDGQGDACDIDDDSDGDGIVDGSDNCAARANPNQADTDRDGIGDVCEREDTDGDGVQNYEDNCPFDANAGQFDEDRDGIGDICDPDRDDDADGIPNPRDNCPFQANSTQSDADRDGTGDACDLGDTDGDGLSDAQETITGTNTGEPTPLGSGINTYTDGQPSGVAGAAAGQAVGVAIVAPPGVDSVAVTVTDPGGSTAFERTLVPQSPVVFSFTPGTPGTWRITAKLFAATSLVATLERTLQVGGAATCNGLRATIVGTEESETILGTPGPDVIHGLGGDDTIDGLEGDDVICGGPGKDMLLGDDGDDIILGGDDGDVIYGGQGYDKLDGQDGGDYVDGGYDDDDLLGGAGDDKLSGGPGIDFCDGGSGVNVVHDCENGETRPDQDGDGVTDVRDECELTAGTAEFRGCSGLFRWGTDNPQVAGRAYGCTNDAVKAGASSAATSTILWACGPGEAAPSRNAIFLTDDPAAITLLDGLRPNLREITWP